MTVQTGPPADAELKARHRAMWASGDYPRIAREVTLPLAPILVRACGIGAGQRVLDVASGTGNVAIEAARAGADVVASDLTPELFEDGRRLAAEAGVELEWREADAEALPFPDASFDVVTSAIGAMFAPRHQPVADELVRVCRPGGTIGMINWTPEGQIGDMFRSIGAYAPPPPPGAQPPPLWGSEEHLRELFGDRVQFAELRRAINEVDLFDGPEELHAYFADNYGPTIAVRGFNAGDPERLAALDAELLAVADRWMREDPQRGRVLEQEYLLAVMRRV